MPGALDGVKIIDVATGMAAAAAGMILADNGAEVIKVEPPGGEALRAWDASRVWHRNKASLALDLERPEGRAVLLRLLEDADAFVETFRPGEAERLGLDYPALAARFPRLVYCSLTGYVEASENAAHAPYGELVEARMGLQSEQRGYREGPIFLGWPHAEWGAAFNLDLGLLAALYRQRLTGRGQRVQTSLEEGIAVLSTARWVLADKLPDLPFVTSRAMARGKRAVVGHFQCQDGEWLALHTQARGAFGRLMRLLGFTHLIDETIDPRHELSAALPEGVDWQDLWVELTAVFYTRPRDEWIRLLREAEIPTEPVLKRGEAFADAQIQAIGMVAAIEDPELGPVRTVGLSQRFSRTPGRLPPRLAGPPGADGPAILAGHGYSESEIAALRAAGILGVKTADDGRRFPSPPGRGSG